MTPSSSPAKWTLRVEDIPDGTTREHLQWNLRSLKTSSTTVQAALRTIEIRSLARKSQRFLTATITVITTPSANKTAEILNQVIRKNELRYHVDNAFGGITPLNDDFSNAVCDIIAIPGLNCHPAGTWKSPINDEIWLRDWLPEDIPNVRVLLYGYDSPIQDSDDISSIEDMSQEFLESLTSFRCETGTTARPIIFLGHSLGGLLVKEALVQSYDAPNNKPDHQQLHQSCRGIVFFGVPHWGMRLESLLRIVMHKPNEEFIRSIVLTKEQEASAYLKRLSKNFAKAFDSLAYGNIHVVSIFERKETETIRENSRKELVGTGQTRFLVTEQSATMHGSQGIYHGDPIPFRTNHSDLIKMPQRDNNYHVTRNRILTMIDQLCQQPEDSQETQPQEFQPPNQQLLGDNNQAGSSFDGNYYFGDGGSHHLGNNQTIHFKYS